MIDSTLDRTSRRSAMPATGDSPQELLLSHLDFIRGRVQQLCRRHRASADTVEELFGDLKVKLLENDYEVLRRFRGDCKLTTYLSVVIDRFFFDWTSREWGAWRGPAGHEASAAAQEVERWVGRDGFSRDEALRITAGRHPIGTGAVEWQLAGALPKPRTRLRPRLVGLEAAPEHVPAPAPSPEEALCATEARDELDGQLERALAALAAQDRLLVKLRYGQGLSVARIARTLGLRQRELYSRVGRALARLRQSLQAEGVTWRGVREQLARLEHLPDSSKAASDEQMAAVTVTGRPDRQEARPTCDEARPHGRPDGPSDARRSAS
jgi:RNA polymerase sigma factor (sigma-70 family)